MEKDYDNTNNSTSNSNNVNATLTTEIATVNNLQAIASSRTQKKNFFKDNIEKKKVNKI